VTGWRLLCLAASTIGSFPLLAQDSTNPNDSKEKSPTPFIDRVVMFQRGSGGGNGEDKLPDIVLGPPQGGGKLEAGRDVLSLGEGGCITVEFVDNEVVDGPGPDFIVFENPFLAAPGNDPDFGFFELAKVEVSFDGEAWTGFPYDTGSRKGCAGHHPVLANAETNQIDPTDPKGAGGDQFDLKEIGVKVIRFVRITDVQSYGGDDGAAGFDLDAIAAVHSRPRPAEKKPAAKQTSTKQQQEVSRE
jgi:hypothetical protein